jgi:TrmH family RNA methyltransferase
MRAVAADRRLRRAERLMLLEGVRLVADGLASGLAFEAIVYDEATLEATAAGRALHRLLLRDPCGLPASPRAVGHAADTVQPQGVVGLARWPAPPPGTAGVTLVLDELQDPGNAGTLLRSAEAAGAVQVLATRGSVDLYAPKVVRAAMGAHARLALAQDLTWSDIVDRLLGVPLLVADALAATPHYAVNWLAGPALIIGNEARGISAAARRHATGTVMIPMLGGESLNAAVAGSVMLFEAARQRAVSASAGPERTP